MKFKLAGAIALTSVLGLVAACGEQTTAETNDPTRVDIDSGTLVGTLEDGVVTFKGFPFAQAPVGDLRWRPPQPVTWEGEFNANEWGHACPQPLNEDGSANGGGVTGDTDEDCLYMNVFAPENAENAPVMLWLYGGAGYLGAGHLGSYQGTSFAKDGVIVVTINYRLGVLGNFVHPALTAEAEANGDDLDSYALMDAIAGLEWIQNNVEALGGDPSNVTLFGQSAGGSLVSRLIASPAAEGLFTKAIVHSGTNLRGGISLEQGEARGAEIATAVGLNGADATLEELRAVDPAMFTDNTAIRSGVGSVLDGHIISQSLEEALTNGTANTALIVAGSNNGEGGVSGASQLVDLAAGDDTAAWQYYFTYVPEWRQAEWANGAIHSAEIMYAWDSTDTSSWAGEAGASDADREVARLMHSCWVAIANASLDTDSLSCADGFAWESRVPGEGQAAEFGATPSMIDIRPVIEEAMAAAAARAAN